VPTYQSYQINLPVYSGPLDLLLHLIENNELDITSISLLVVTDQYLTHVEKLKESKIEHLLDFLVMAARLLLIKSRALLPQPEASLIVEDPDDPADMLARQLREYKRYKEAGTWLIDRRDRGLRTYLRIAPIPQIESTIDLTGINTELLFSAINEAFDRTRVRESSLSLATQERHLTIEGQIEKLQQRMNLTGQTSFSQLLSADVTFQEISVTLLAVLELIKRQEILVRQQVIFGPIEILPVQASSPGQATATSR